MLWNWPRCFRRVDVRFRERKLMSSLLAAFKTQPDTILDPDHDAAEVDRRYRYWRVRILVTTIVGYALYYFVRSNINVPLKTMGADLGYTKAQLGFITSIGGVTYG